MRPLKHYYIIYSKDLSPLFTGKITYVIPALSTAGAVLVPVNTYEVRNAITLVISFDKCFYCYWLVLKQTRGG